jgi:hypothetical protein
MEDLYQYRGHLDRIAEANGLTDDILAKVWWQTHNGYNNM